MENIFHNILISWSWESNIFSDFFCSDCKNWNL